MNKLTPETTKQRTRHWDAVYGKRRHTDVSWYQAVPETSLRLIEATGVAAEAPILDVGGGASTLVDHLLDCGFTDVSVLDLAPAAFEQSRARLGPRARDVDWIVADVTRFEPQRAYALWHDRAVLHFLTDAGERERYIDVLQRALAAGGFLLLATFGPDGPERCSGLEVRRYGVEEMQALLGARFELRHQEIEVHRTPSGGAQQFLCTSWQRTA